MSEVLKLNKVELISIGFQAFNSACSTREPLEARYEASRTSSLHRMGRKTACHDLVRRRPDCALRSQNATFQGRHIPTLESSTAGAAIVRRGRKLISPRVE
jgi:hypothetical protein